MLYARSAHCATFFSVRSMFSIFIKVVMEYESMYCLYCDSDKPYKSHKLYGIMPVIQS